MILGQDRRKLLRIWVEQGENRQACEASCVLSKSQSTKMQGTKELVSVQEMVRRKWPRNKILGAIRGGGGVKDEHAPDDPTLTSYWRRVSTQQVDTTEVRQDSQVRIQSQVDANVISAVTAAPTLDSSFVASAGISDQQLQELAASIGALGFVYHHHWFSFEFCFLWLCIYICLCVFSVSDTR